MYTTKETILLQKKDTRFSELFQVPTYVKEAINITDGGSITSVISEMINIGLKSESTEDNYKK